ncbi:cytochrome P450 [Spinactinospora alkalitolerans]|uniref:Cytochrome P450 n=2 Tax=Spinactinospora alkalitolerans TaxID=687207 RepID=A0A852TNX2_9ACTN|nr:cytochrome P450 [Spinactinospora alkalitolerans]
MFEMFEYLAAECSPETMRPGSMGAAIFEARDRGVVTPEEVPGLLSVYSTGGLDTTIHAITTGIRLLIDHPDQWDLVRENPKLVTSAFNEILRYAGPAHGLARTLTRDHTIGGVPVPAGARFIILYSAANRDERHYADPDRFDVTRNPVDHLGFGNGAHMCPGAPIARLEGRYVFEAFAHRVRRFTLDGEPERLLNNTMRGYRHLPVAVEPAAPKG